MANEFDYESIFGADFAIIREGLEIMPDNIEGMLLGIMDSMVYNVDNFAKNLEQTITQLTANGVRSETILSTLKADHDGAGRIFGQLRNDTKGNLAMGIANSGRLGQYEDYTNKSLFAWVTVAGHKVCLDCDGRGGQISSYLEWESEGLPGSGWSVCKGYCYCVLDPSGKVSDKVKGAKVKEAKAATIPKAPAIPSWHKQFSSKNLAANVAFQNAFAKSPEKFLKLITKFPELKHIASGSGSSFHTTGSWKYIERYLKLEGTASREYLSKYGGINMRNISRVDSVTVIRHEYGHFLHQNAHYQGLGRDVINDLVKRYRLSKHNGNPLKFLQEESVFTKVVTDPTAWNYNYHKKVGGLVDLLKYDDACVATKKRLGLGRGKAQKEIFEKKWLRYKELDLKTSFGDDLKDYMNRFGEYDHARKAKVKDLYKSFPKNDKFIKAFTESKAEYVREYFNDLLGALTREKIGEGHGYSYYQKRGFVSGQHHETFANLTCLYTHENPIYWEFIKQEMPELAEYFESFIDKVLSQGYFGH